MLKVSWEICYDTELNKQKCFVSWWKKYFFYIESNRKPAEGFDLDTFQTHKTSIVEICWILSEFIGLVIILLCLFFDDADAV